MTTMTQTDELTHSLSGNKKKHELFVVLRDFRSRAGDFSKEQLTTLLGQWYHPLHYFPVFLSRVISVAASLEMQTHVSRILWQELGEGDPARSHEKLFIDTFLDVGFEQTDLVGAKPLAGTRELMVGYRESSSNYLDGLGFMYGTEVVDLALVSTFGSLVLGMTGPRQLPWVDIHVSQEPDHVATSIRALTLAMTDAEQEQIAKSAENAWDLWLGFCTSLKQEMFPEPVGMSVATGDGAKPSFV